MSVLRPLFIFLSFYIIQSQTINLKSCNTSSFPPNFKFGAGSSAYQIEGAWNVDGKGRSWWDWLYNSNLVTSTGGNSASGSYYRYQDDVEALESIGTDFYRFSISWSRILPTGLINEVNQAGVDYYHNLLNALEEKGIEPLVTIFHWDIPNSLIYLGGWTNPHIVQYFVDYADLVFKLFGDRVKLWATINEPRSFCQTIPDTVQAIFFPEILTGNYDYLCGHYALLAHASAYRLYQKKYKRRQNGRIGIVLDIVANLPLTDSSADLEASKRAYTFDFDWFARPLVKGDYPQLMKDIVRRNSALQNFSTSRLPSFTKSEKRLIKGSYDIFFVNHYTSHLVTLSNFSISPSWNNDKQITLSVNSSWLLTNIDMTVYPASIRIVLNYIKDTYKIPEIFITENGYSNAGGSLNDTDRISFLKDVLHQVRLAMCEDKINIVGYTYWSLLDSFEWMSQYRAKFGLVHVNFDTLQRTLKLSSQYYRKLIKTRLINSIV
ncbi:myrosinase 1-like [Euwallacea fornicatus]|uniref:myrosinase 1-like n=1 Tax=Euwallacea fornicatus TaxID=995702 RepID=UPI00338E9143